MIDVRQRLLQLTDRQFKKRQTIAVLGTELQA
jgi:hypothetical protein